MQYILTEEEYAKLIDEESYMEAVDALGLARTAILQLAGVVCIHDSFGQKVGDQKFGYCSGCPLATIDKANEERGSWHLLCGKAQFYGK